MADAAARGRSLAEIAETLGLTYMQVRHRIRKIREAVCGSTGETRWLKESTVVEVSRAFLRLRGLAPPE